MFIVKKRMVRLTKGTKCDIMRHKIMYGDSFVRVVVKQKDKHDRLAFLPYNKMNKNLGRPDNSVLESPSTTILKGWDKKDNKCSQ